MLEGKVPVMSLNADSERECLEAIRMAIEQHLSRERNDEGSEKDA